MSFHKVPGNAGDESRSLTLFAQLQGDAASAAVGAEKGNKGELI